MPTPPAVQPPVVTLDGVPTALPAAAASSAETSLTQVVARAFAGGSYRVELLVDVLDTASIDLAQRHGFAYEGRRRAAAQVDGARRDLAAFARTAGDAGTAIAPAYPAVSPGDLTDGTISLREATVADADAVFEEESDPQSMAVSVNGEPDRDEIERMLARAPLERRVGPSALFAIVDVATDRCAGTIRIRSNGPPRVAMYGYAVHPAFRGRGYTTRALRLLSPWVFASTAIVRLELGAKTDNVASQKAALAAGFSPDGIMLARLRNPDGSFSDEARFYLLKP